MYISARVLTGEIRIYSDTSRSDDSIVDRSDQTLDSSIFQQLRTKIVKNENAFCLVHN